MTELHRCVSLLFEKHSCLARLSFDSSHNRPLLLSCCTPYALLPCARAVQCVYFYLCLFLSAEMLMYIFSVSHTLCKTLLQVPVLPAFQGNVPPVVATLFPDANISVQGGGRHYAAWLDAEDPLFQKIGDACVMR
jgi:hypothetical protein